MTRRTSTAPDPRPSRRRSRRSAALAILLGATALAGAPGASHAQSVCMPEASGVPALGGAPNWWDSAPGEPQFWPRPDDPRWRGAFLHVPMPASATIDHLTFRALRTSGALFLQWRITVDPQLDAGERLRVAFSPGGGKPDVLLQIQPFNSPAAVSAQAPVAVQVSQRTGAVAFAGLATPPAWINPPTTDTRVWLDPTGQSWTVDLRVPIAAAAAAGIDLATSFKFWFEVRVSHPMSTVVNYRYPPTLSFDAVENGTSTVGWADARRDVVPSTAGCIQGVSLLPSDVGTVAAGGCPVPDPPTPATPLSTDIRLVSGGAPATNTFCARPLNGSGAQIAAGEVDAIFRIANWGTQPDWNAVPNPLTTLWKTINPVPVTGPDVANGATGSLAASWTPTAAEVCSFDPRPPGFNCTAFPAPNQRKHQCMLVELGGAPGLSFSTSSVYRNMSFVDASTFRREAEVSVVGLEATPTPEPERDVFLYVQTDNLPARVVGGGAPPPRPRVPPPRPGASSLANPNREGPEGGDDGDTSQGPVEPLEKTPYETLRETEPTYQVHAFHDTGLIETFEGQTVRVLAPMTSFGYFVDHKGELEGWRHEVIGAQRIAPSYYLIAVPEQGTATVTTVIEALEPSRWSLSLHAGKNDPRGDLGSSCSGDLSWGVDLEYRFTSLWAAELFYGHEDFDCDGPDDTEIDHLSLNGKAYFLAGTWRPFVGAGIGSYDVSPGSSEIGGNLFAGLQANLLPRLGVEATARYHLLESGSDDADFLTYHLGLRLRF